MRLPSNPYDAVPPDYLVNRYAASRQTFIDDFHISNQQAAQRLTDIWIEQNTIDREEWDAQVEAEALLAEQREEQICVQEEERQRREEEELEQAKQDERKKNRNKFLPFADAPMSATPPVIPSPLALRKLRKGEFCELYFFTNKGLADAQVTSYSADDEALTLVQDEQGMHSFIPIASAKAKQNVVDDKDLTWLQIDKATHRIIQAMRECSWDEARIQAHVEFWIALGSHSWRHHHDERCRRALIQYQAVARRRWHDTLGTPNSFNLKYIQSSLLDDIRTEIVDSAAAAAASAAKEASSLSFLSFFGTHN
jgi:hypothetical protein